MGDCSVAWSSTTHRFEAPEGSAYVTVCETDEGPWIDCTVGKSGSGVRADAHALAAVCGIALRHGTPPIKLVHALKEITHEGSADMRLAKRSGAKVALSVADAIGDTIWQELT